MSDIDNAALQNIWEALLGIQDAIEALNPERHMSQTCQHHRCDYFNHYLAKGPADLTHEGYHAAETENAKWQETCGIFEVEHPDDPIPREITSMCTKWEEALRL